MILGIGVDLCSKKRIDQILQKLEHHFTEQILTDIEIDQGTKYIDFSRYLTSRFSFKEAFYKAANFSDQRLLNWKDVSLLDENKEKFRVLLSHKAKKILRKNISLENRLRIGVSISNTSDLIVSKVIISYYSLI